MEGGWGLDGVLRDNNWKLRGIVNGMDYNEWSPQRDFFLTSDGYRQYGYDDYHDGKAACKAALQRASHLLQHVQTGCCILLVFNLPAKTS